MGSAILANIAMFMPFGFLSAALWKRRIACFWIVLLALAFSALIESMQLFLMRGMFEFDDIFSNVFGAFLGTVVFRAIRRFLPERFLKSLLPAMGIGIMLFCFGMILIPGDGENSAQTSLSQGLFFQVDKASMADDTLEITGVCFWHQRKTENYKIVLQSTRTGDKRFLSTVCGISRPEVDTCFAREELKAGFEAAAPKVKEGEEYEILLDFGFLRVIPTGVYLTVMECEDTQRRYAGKQVSIHYAPDEVFQPPEAENTDLKKIVSDGVLRAYDRSNCVYVYWYEGRLYWIADDGFFFEEDGTTRIELKLWTAQTEKLSEKSRRTGKKYDLLGVCFEKAELDGDFGQYRVCAAELSADYAIISITTGQYSHGWIWKETFWPVYPFIKDHVSGSGGK